MMRNLLQDLHVPGVYFLPPPGGAVSPLPPLDVAAFVGFAERGPLNLPVPIEDPGSFSAIFGGDLPLAVERSTRLKSSSPPAGSAGQVGPRANGKVLYANLPRAVEAFFANGGRRCYVVRVAGREARAARFRIPGIVALGSSTVPARLAAVAASSPGAWGDRLRLAARLQITPLEASGFTWVKLPSGPVLSTRQSLLAQAGLQVGDVLRLGLDDGSSWILSVKASTAGGLSSPPSQDDLTLLFDRVYRLWDKTPASPPMGLRVASRLTVDGLEPLETSGPLDFKLRRLMLALTPCDLERVQPGDVLLLELDDDRNVLFPVEALAANGDTVSLPLSPSETFYLAEGFSLLQISPDESPALTAAIEAVELLHFDLLPRLEDQRLPVVAGLSYNLGGERFWGEVLLPETGLRRSAPVGGSAKDRLRARDYPALTARGQDRLVRPSAPIAAAWFRRVTWDSYGLTPPEYRQQVPEAPILQPSDTLAVLSGLLAPLGSDVSLDYDETVVDGRAAYQKLVEEPLLTYLPVGMPLFFDESDTRQFTGAEEGREGKDGLSAFTPEILLDPRLSPPGLAGATGLGESARTLMASALDLNAIQGRRLYGLHSLLFIDEVALVSVPDAPHREWEKLGAPISPPPPRPAVPPEEPACPPEADFHLCNLPPKVFQVEPYYAPLGQETPVTLRGEGFTSSLKTQVFFGLRPASHVEVLSTEELVCLAPQGLTAGTVNVRVANEKGAGELSEAFVYESAIFGLAPDLTVLPVIDLDAPELEVREEPFLPIHQALLDFCQARGDCLAVLNLPRRYELRRCLAWQDEFRLRLGLPPINPLAPGGGFEDLAEIADLSFAAVYHPWLSVAEAGAQGGVRDVPPDGAICGLIAAREHQRGVWVAPANVRLRGVVGLQPDFSDDDWAVLFSRRFNLTRQESDGYRPMSAHTLSNQRDLLQISTRRLMILLRKVAWRLGMDFVFETNHERFREGVRVLLEDMLRDLFKRGAFSGGSPDLAFRVITDAQVNPPQSIDQGRFVVVIQVAPSKPMEFLTVQLIRAGEAVQISVS
jgi:hypothetical protein